MYCVFWYSLQLLLETSEPKKNLTIYFLCFTYITIGSASYFVSILTKLVFPRQSSLAVPTKVLTEIRPLGADRQTERLVENNYLLVAFRKFYNCSKM